MIRIFITSINNCSLNASGKTTRTEELAYTYDGGARPTKVTHKLNSGSTVTLAEYSYDEFCRMATKTVNENVSGSKTLYAYNLHGWLVDMHHPYMRLELAYNNGTTGFNGNITKLTCSLPYSLSQNYSFTYDGANRMLDAIYSESYSMNQNVDRYTEKVTEYDKNGNIKKLQRYGQTGSSTYGLVDNLTYTYNGNKVTRVDDAVTATSYTGGTNFVNGANTNNEYVYDANGNMTKDLNKGISNIQYNSLNLPSVVTFSDGSTITYTYTYDGKKLRTVHVIGGVTTTTDYCGNVIYENGTAKRLLTDEGYVDLTTNTYYYYLKDHQGNNRVVINSSGIVQETNHYYPFGGLFATSTNVQPYKYNGKELDTKKGLNLYDYGARHYDATLGRWHVVDPMAEKYYPYSVYVYCDNNPINKIDPIGKEWEDVEEAERLKNNINNKIQSLERSITKKQSQLDNENITKKKAEKLKKQIDEGKERISYLQISLNDIDLLGNDKNNVYVFSKTNGGEHHVKKADDGRILIETSSDAISLHEISHVRQSLNNYGKLLFTPNGYLYNAGRTSEELFSKMEIEAYRIQYSYDLSFPGNLYKKGIQGIDAKSVGNIYNPNTGKYVYEIIHKYSLKLK